MPMVEVSNGGTSTSTELIATNYAARAYADSAGYANISYTATEDCYIFCMVSDYRCGSAAGLGTITIGGSGTTIFSSSITGNPYIKQAFTLAFLPAGSSVNITNYVPSGHAGGESSYYAFKFV